MALGVRFVQRLPSAMECEVECVDIAGRLQTLDDLVVEERERIGCQWPVGARPSMHDGRERPVDVRLVDGLEEAAHRGDAATVREDVLTFIQTILSESFACRKSRAEAAGFLTV